MKTIGLIGGMSWESSAQYYRLINEAVRRPARRLPFGEELMLSVDFADIEALQSDGQLGSEAVQLLADAARRLEPGGADFILLCTNTMHRVAGELDAATAASPSSTSPTPPRPRSKRRR